MSELAGEQVVSFHIAAVESFKCVHFIEDRTFEHQLRSLFEIGDSMTGITPERMGSYHKCTGVPRQSVECLNIDNRCKIHVEAENQYLTALLDHHFYSTEHWEAIF